jgi:SAM-dependent methyltransferase
MTPESMENGGRVDQHIKGSGKAPSLFGRLAHRSGVMTFEGISDAASDGVTCNPRFTRIATMVERHLQGGDVLDVGCWTGALARVLAGRIHCSYTGVDIEPASRAVEAARKAMPDQRFLTVPSVESLPFNPESFDVVVLTEVIEHVPVGREGPLLAELARVLKRRGSIILSTPYHNLLNPLDPAWFFGHRHYSVDRIAELARSHGLSMTDVEFSGGVWSAIDTNLLYFYKHVLHRPYASQRWLSERIERECYTSSRRALATTLWCRLVR